MPHPYEDPAQPLHVRELCAIADILLGAAHADRDFDRQEGAAIEAILEDFVGPGNLPAAVVTHLTRFEPDRFDLVRACRALRFEEDEQRQALLALVLRVVAADQVADPLEDVYVRKVAQSIGARPPVRPPPLP